MRANVSNISTPSRRSKTEEALTVEIVFPWAEEHQIALEEIDTGKYIVKNVRDYRSMEKIMENFDGWWQTKADIPEIDSPLPLTRAESQMASPEYERIKREKRSIANLDNVNNFWAQFPQTMDSSIQPISAKNRRKSDFINLGKNPESEIVEPIWSLPKKAVSITSITPKSDMASGFDPKSNSNGSFNSQESMNCTPIVPMTEEKLQEDRGSAFRAKMRDFIKIEISKLDSLIEENSSDQKFPSFLNIESNIHPIQGKFNSRDQFTGLGLKYSKSQKLLYRGYFLNDALHGFGIKYRQSGTLLYRGEFQHSEFHGRGIKYFDSDQNLLKNQKDIQIPENYIGNFRDGKFSSQGIKYSTTGVELYYGFFDMGKYWG